MNLKVSMKKQFGPKIECGFYKRGKLSLYYLYICLHFPNAGTRGLHLFILIVVVVED